MSDDILPLETLERLSRRDGLDTRPILIRVLTDLFVQKADHSAEETARYEELVLGLLDVVSVEARAAVARKLADDHRAPAAVIERLIADEAAVSAPILARFPDAPRHVLLARVMDGGPVEAAAVASRRDLDADLIRLLAHNRDELVLETLAANLAARLGSGPLASLVERARGAPALAAALLRREDLDAGALAALYLHAGPTRRAEIREALAARPARPLPARASRNAEPVEAAIAEAAVSEGKGHLIAEVLAEALRLRPDDAARLATEPSGEPFVLMLRSIGVEPDLVTRALLIAQPEIAPSVVRVFDLVELAETTSRAVAHDILAALTGEADRASAAPRHEPLFEQSGVMERAGAARPASQRRPSARGADQRQRG
ncbi:DUF2336 domain-containing protein [Chenggangzhangella methanolivorans]|uniref:DUF2336 domain-containing protein n=1 Tax=Chenggangzhangella methanolivorans TaxID=1437009 RepID=A0A9E6RCK7_9HYPH|nr:DUF2336 domain-containing protein [Chenggangzhangella methanolivorans]QZO00819.1 DUF2336 domain-containing protein [Chenggangzhangella methanolivorans]